MQGPTTATISRRAAPKPSMAMTVSSSTPSTAPRQPACAPPITPALRSANNTGAQSPVIMPRIRPARRVTTPSASGRRSSGQASSATTTRLPCTCVKPHSASCESPSAAAARVRFSRTAAASSLPESEQFSDAKAPFDTPPLRVKNPCTTPGSCKGSASKNSALMRFRIQQEWAGLNRIAPAP